jgi:ribosomal protein L16 Arg81 hydroxylase
MLASLGDVVSPISVSEFLQAFHDKRRLHIKTADPARAASLLPWQEIETMISMRSFDGIEAMQNGMLIPPQLYQAEANMSAFHDILVQGASIIVKQIHLKIPQIQRLATAIERQLAFPVGVNAYFSFSKGGAFKPHWDRHDVFVVQVHGKKAWRLWDPQFKKSRDAQYDITAAPSEELELSPGDVLYIPRGEPHAAAVSGGESVHLTFGLDCLNGVDLLQQLNNAAGQDDFLRTDLPPPGAEAQLRDYEAELKLRLHRLVDALSIAAFLRSNDLNRPPLRQASIASSEEPGDILRLTLRRRVPLPEATPGGSQPVTIGGATYPLSAAAIDVLRRLFASDGQARRAIMEALSSRHDPAAVTAALRDLSRLGFLATDRAV